MNASDRTTENEQAELERDRREGMTDYDCIPTDTLLERAALNSDNKDMLEYIQDVLINEGMVLELISNCLIAGKPELIDKGIIEIINENAAEYVEGNNL